MEGKWLATVTNSSTNHQPSLHHQAAAFRPRLKLRGDATAAERGTSNDDDWGTLPLAAGHQRPELAIDDLQLSSIGSFVTAASCSCGPPEDASDDALINLKEWNCRRITEAGENYTRLAQLYGQKVNSLWEVRLKSARLMCEQATNSSDLTQRAALACCAWGDVLMQHRECCNVAGPPYCVNPPKSKMGHALPLIIVLVVAFMVPALAKCCRCEGCCRNCCRNSFFAPRLMHVESVEDGAPETGHAVPRNNDAVTLQQKLENIWDKRSLKTLENADLWKNLSVKCFVDMQVAFDFQLDSVQNQYEHFLSLWRSHVSVYCDRKQNEIRVWDERHLLPNALAEPLNFTGAGHHEGAPQDMMEWVALWGTGFMCYVADTQYWFVLGCGLLGCILALLQRGSDLGGSLWAFVSWLHGGGATKEDDLREKTAQADGIQQKNRYFSCLLDGSCDLDEKPKKLRLSALKEDATKEEEQKWAAEKAKYEARLVEVEEWSEKASVEQRPRLKVELPGAPILSNGKPDNQNTAIHFTRGSIIQCIDCNQGGYFEQMLLLPCALGEFRQSNPQHTGLNPRIVGFAEHITSDIGSLGDFAAGAETAFGTMLQRCYAFLGGRMHYGHPDMMNKDTTDATPEYCLGYLGMVTLGGAKYMATGRGLPTTRRATIQAGKVEVKVVDGKEVKEFKGQSLYTDYATAALYDGAQLLLGTVLVILGGGLDIGSSARWSLFWWLFALGMTICSWLLAPFIFNPYQFKCQHMCTDWWNWWDFFFANKGQNWKNWYEIERLQRDAGLRSSFVEIIKKAIFLGAWYTIFNQKAAAMPLQKDPFGRPPKLRTLVDGLMVVLNSSS
eukprot:Skav235858  [mRNA]  locus=scaffold1693:278367:302523:- [translate_table: standard]